VGKVQTISGPTVGRKTQGGGTRSPHRGHCIPFWAVVSALPTAPTFACSVASLCRCAGYHAPGLLSLRRGALAHRGLARGSSSVQFARRVRVCKHSRPHFTPYSGVTVEEPRRQGLRSGWPYQASLRNAHSWQHRTCAQHSQRTAHKDITVGPRPP